MNKKIIILSLVYLMPLFTFAQTIKFSLPKDSNKDYAFILNKGTLQDTIQKGRLSFTGAVTIRIPQKEKGYIGMGSLQIKGRAPLNVIVNRESFDVVQGTDMNYAFRGSKENDYLYSIMQNKANPKPDPTLFASHFIGLIRYMQQQNKVITQGGSLAEIAQVRAYALNQLDMERLYTSGIWYNVVDGLTKLTIDQQRLGEDMVHILKRIESQEVFEHLVENLITITEQYGWDDAFDVIIPYVEHSRRIKVPRDKIFTAFSLAKVRKGSTPPPLDGLSQPLDKSNAQKTLLVFYQPDCDNCHAQLNQLIKRYSKLKQLGVRVISISADSNRNAFNEDIKRFPWPNSDKLCDFKGFAGKNFVNYGIMGTPTFFLLDSSNKVIRRYALVTDIEFSNNK